MESNQPILNEKNICVVGAGLAGLANIALTIHYAAETKNTHFNITLVEKRKIKGANRKERLIITGNKELASIDALEIDWETLCATLFNPNEMYSLREDGTLTKNNIPILKDKMNDREKILYKLMSKEELSNDNIFKNFTIQSMLDALWEYIDENTKENKKVNFTLKDTNTIEEITIKDKIILTLKNDKEKIEADNLYICQGGSREDLDKVNLALQKSNHSDFQFKHTPLPNAVPKYNFSMHLVLEKLTDQEKHLYSSLQNIFNRKVNKSSELKSQIIKTLQKYYGDLPLSKINYVLDHNINKYTPFSSKTPELYLAAAIPYKIYKEAKKDKSILIALGKSLAALYTSLPESRFSIHPERNDIHLFKSGNLAIEEGFLLLKNGLLIGLAGDSAFDPNYLAGVSSTLGLQQSHGFAICSVLEDEEEFNIMLGNMKELFKYHADVLNGYAEDVKDIQELFRKQ